jgi:hypothetical protein
MHRAGLGIWFALLSCSVQNSRAKQTPENGFVPDARTAIRIAEAALAARFGDKSMEADRPFAAKLENEVWTVVGSVNCGHQQSARSDSVSDVPADRDEYMCVGGTGSAKISKRDGTILELHQTQ